MKPSHPPVVRNLSFNSLQKPLASFVDRLMEMGWSELQAIDALNVCKNDFGLALTFLVNLERYRKIPKNDRQSFILTTNAFTLEELERALARESGIIPNDDLQSFLRGQITNNNQNNQNNNQQQQQINPPPTTQYELFGNSNNNNNYQQQQQQQTNFNGQHQQQQPQNEQVIVNADSNVLFRMRKPTVKGLLINSKLNTSPNEMASSPPSSPSSPTPNRNIPNAINMNNNNNLNNVPPSQNNFNNYTNNNNFASSPYSQIPKDSQMNQTTTTTSPSSPSLQRKNTPQQLPHATMAIELSREEIVFEQEIGKGNFSIVYRANFRGKRYACKVLNADVDQNQFLRETEIMARLEPHKNVLQLIGIVSIEQPFCMLTEIMDTSLLKLSRSVQLAAPTLFHIVIGIAQGLRHLHQHSIVHRDLACRNILLKPGQTIQWEPKISDFGLSRLMEGRGQISSISIAGSVVMMAPESLLSRVFSQATDVYSFGILLCELYGRTEPYSHLTSNRMQIAMLVASGELTAPIPPMAPKVIQAIIKDCFSYDPSKRPTMHSIVEKLEHI